MLVPGTEIRCNPDKTRSVPVRRFRQLLHAIAPELVVLTRETSPDDADPLLYCARPFPAPVMHALVAVWAADLPRGEDAAGPLRDTVLQLQASGLVHVHWSGVWGACSALTVSSLAGVSA
jgi:pPIWI_RE module N-terminal domain